MIPAPEHRSPENSHESVRQKRSEITRLVFLLAIALIVLVLSFRTALQKQDTRSRAAITGPMLAILPSGVAVQSGETANLAVSIASGPDSIAAVAIDIPYDASVLDVISFVPSPVFPVILSPPRISAGRLRVTLGVLPMHPYSGTGILGTLTVRGISKAQKTLGFGDDTAVASVGKRSNSVVSKKSAIVSVVGPSDSGGANSTSVNLPVEKNITTSLNTISTEASNSSVSQASGKNSMVQSDYSPYTDTTTNTDGLLTPIIHFLQSIWSLLRSLF